MASQPPRNQSAVLKNTGVYPEGIMGSRCCLVTSENAWFGRGEEGMCAIFARDMRAAPGAVVGSGRGGRVYFRGFTFEVSLLSRARFFEPCTTTKQIRFLLSGSIVAGTCHD